MRKVAVIGGSRLANLNNLSVTHSTTVKTPYGEPSAPLSYGMLGDQEVVYMPRRGSETEGQPPHKINYRANIWALRDAGVQLVIATNSVAAINTDREIGDIVLPDQLIDYTYGRENTFFGDESSVSLIKFADPYDERLRGEAISVAHRLNTDVVADGTFGITQGPRFETKAEIARLERDRCDIVGMTGMPEASLARELDLNYMAITLVVRRAAGKEDGYNMKDPKLQSRLKEQERNIEKLIEAMICHGMPMMDS